MLKKNSKLKYIKSRLNPRLSPNPPERYWFCLCVVFDFKFTIWHLQIHKFCFFFFTYGPILSLTAEPPPSYRLLCESNPSAWCMEQMFDLPPHTPKHRNWNTVGGIISPRFTQSQMQTACEKCKVGSSEIQSKWEKVPEEGDLLGGYFTCTPAWKDSYSISVVWMITKYELLKSKDLMFSSCIKVWSDFLQFIHQRFS